MQEGGTRVDASMASEEPVGTRYTEGGEDQLAPVLSRLRREPAMRQWVLSSPAVALASLGVALDDTEIVTFLDQVEAMEDRPLPVTAGDVMTPNPITVDPAASIHEAAALLTEHGISGLPVCDPDRGLVGVLSEYDLIARSGSEVRDIMSRDVVSVRDSAHMDAVRALFISRRLKRVPVVDKDGKLLGLISRADLVRELAYRWTCSRCGNTVRARRAPTDCERCGAANSFEPAPQPQAVSACPTCGRPLDGK